MPRTTKLEDHLTSAELQQRYLRCEHRADRTRWHALWLVSLGQSGNEAARLVGRTSGWMSVLVRRYNEQGAASVITVKREGRQWGGSEAALRWGTSEETELYEALVQAPRGGGIWTAAKVAAWLAERRGHDVHLSTGWRTLKRLRQAIQMPRPEHPEACQRRGPSRVPKKIIGLAAQLRHAEPEQRVWLCFQDEARFGLKPTYRRVWAPIGQRPTAPSRTRYEWSYVFATVHPETGTTHALILPVANIKAMLALSR